MVNYIQFQTERKIVYEISLQQDEQKSRVLLDGFILQWVNLLILLIDCHFIREKLDFGDITSRFVNSNGQLADIFTKSLRGLMIDYICCKLGTYDLYAPI